MRQSFAGMLWPKQFCHYVVKDWIAGDPPQSEPPPERRTGRNSDWHHLYNADVISMPDKWEYPWYAAWDLAFQCVPLALVDSEFAKEQLTLMVREWYMHPNGQLPAYEWAFGDVNPPVRAWAAWRVFKIEKKRCGVGDREFLQRIFHKLLLNFTWWVNRKDFTGNVACLNTSGMGERRLLSIVSADQLRSVLKIMLDETEFLSPHGVHAVSRHHRDQPFVWHINGGEYRVDYEPGESSTGLFGGNSNWRGPIWIPVNYLLIESIQKFGDDFRVECPTGSGNWITLEAVAAELSRRLTRIFLRGPEGRRPVHGSDSRYATDPHWRDLVLYYECFHGDAGSGVGASHQTGWTGLVAKLLQQSGETQ